MEVTCDNERITNTHKHTHSYIGCQVPMGHLHWSCVYMSTWLIVCAVTQDYDAKLNFTSSQPWNRSSFINILCGVLPFSTLASRCMSGNHTRHWGGGSDINVSRNVLRETFFCWRSVQRRGEIQQENSPTTSTLNTLLVLYAVVN